MAIEIRIPTEDHWLELVAVDARAFGWVPNEKEIAQRRPLMDLTRFRIAVDRGRIVAVVGSFALDMTLPGGATIPASGTTWVSVSATHRRQGILTRLMAALHADADDRGEPVSALFASVTLGWESSPHRLQDAPLNVGKAACAGGPHIS